MKKQTLDILAMIPDTPSFIRTPIGVVPMEDLSDEMLKAIGKAWTEELLKKAKARRNTRN